MLSILIPVYNYDVQKLVHELHRQCTLLNLGFEIICMDDDSSASFKNLNRSIATADHVKYEELQQNIGRSSIRNKLAGQAQYEWLLFMDCDSEVVSADFIKNYVHNIDNTDLLYGGRIYAAQPPVNKNEFLHWLYGSEREVKSAEERAKNPYASFMTNNFMIRKDLFLAVKLNEEIKGYGHEDTLLGIELKKRSARMKHISNPLLHAGLEPADEFISKQKQAIKNLAWLIRHGFADTEIKIYRYFLFLKKTGLKPLYLRWMKKREEKYIQQLKSEHPDLKMLDRLKLFYLAQEIK